MWVFTYVGALFNGLTLLILGKSTKPLGWKIAGKKIVCQESLDILVGNILTVWKVEDESLGRAR